ncbi:glycosyltransferase family 4 protein [Nocardioides carbamazepini]|uniref:glycosyltransferase family 4 protein n=1 Tax=Nocardioides carbamazepini TaxID=2854259 RepID=UPI00214A1EBC|nr:glycosyltransferase family 4 protein [Nocardioides carbamazepini]MCR1782002.1 glycosyltransferase family 4 protein [Nocardioides carbamazepini]
MTRRVLQVLTQAHGGPVDHAVDVAIELAALGHDSRLAGPAGPHLVRAAAGGVRTHLLSIHSGSDLRGLRAAATLLAGVRPDLVHLQDRRAGLVGRILARRHGIPAVYTLHGVPDQLAGLVPGNLSTGPARRRDRVAYLTGERLLAATRRTVVVTPCEALTTYARDHVGVPAARVRTVPNGVGRTWLDLPGPDRRPVGRVTAAWLGVMQPVKRVPDLVRAVARVPDLTLDLIGDGPQRARVEAAVARTGCADRVRFLGFLPDPAPQLRAADLLVLPSAAEACPMAVLQAMASGLPVVATRVGGIPEIVRDGVDGLLVDAGAEDQLVAALRALAADAPLRTRMGAAARRRVAERFTAERCARELLAVYEEIG